MNKNIAMVALVSFMFVLSLQIAEPVAAAKLKMVDHGSIKGTDPDMGYYKISWATYQKGTNYVKTNAYVYFGSVDKSVKTSFVIQKLSKNKVKITNYWNGQKIGSYYDYSKLTASRYYWRVFRPELIYGF